LLPEKKLKNQKNEKYSNENEGVQLTIPLSGVEIKETVSEYKRSLLLCALDKSCGSVSEAAKLVGLEKQSFKNCARELGLFPSLEGIDLLLPLDF